MDRYIKNCMSDFFLLSAIFLFCAYFLSSAANAGTLVEVPPAPTLPVYGQTIQVPARATYNSDCVGVSEAGIAGCTTQYTWFPTVGRFRPPQYRSLATAYNVYTGESVALRPLIGDTDTVVSVVTPGGRIVGQSLLRGYNSRIVEWSADGAPIMLDVGIATAADDLGRLTYNNTICDLRGCITPPDVERILALSNSGDYLALYAYGDHATTKLYRASEYSVIDREDICLSPCIGEVRNPPTRAALNSSGVAVWSLGGIGFRAVLGGATTMYGVALADVNESGDVAGGNILVRAHNIVEIVPAGIYSVVDILGLNSARVVVGRAKLGVQWNSPWRAVYALPQGGP